MRDPKRIEKLLKLIDEEWQRHPDLRFCQLLINLGIVPDTTYAWQLEDADIIEHLKKWNPKKKKN
jgi:uncharacterized protein YihD (DUF1040 family)